MSQPTVDAEWFRGNRAIRDFRVTTRDPNGVIDSLLDGQTALRQSRAQPNEQQAQRAEAPREPGPGGDNQVRRLSPQHRSNVARARLQAVREDLQREPRGFRTPSESPGPDPGRPRAVGWARSLPATSAETGDLAQLLPDRGDDESE